METDCNVGEGLGTGSTILDEKGEESQMTEI